MTMDLTIGALAEAAGVGVETVRYYQRRGLLTEPARQRGSVRRYGAEEQARLLFIRSAQRLGFSLEEVAGLLRLDNGAHCAQARALGEARLADVRARLADLRRMETALARLMRECSSTRGKVACPLIAALHGT